MRRGANTRLIHGGSLKRGRGERQTSGIPVGSPMIRLALGLLAMLLAAPIASAVPVWTETFHEDFDGPTLDTTVWTATPNAGTISMIGESIFLRGNTYFPYIRTKADVGPLIPPNAAYRATVDVISTNHTPFGAGIHGSSPFHMWQDYHQNGMRLWFNDLNSGVTLAPNVRRLVEWEWVDGTGRICVDGVSKHTESIPTHGGLAQWTFGNPETSINGGGFQNWNNLHLIDVRIELLTESPPRPKRRRFRRTFARPTARSNSPGRRPTTAARRSWSTNCTGARRRASRRRTRPTRGRAS